MLNMLLKHTSYKLGKYVEEAIVKFAKTILKEKRAGMRSRLAIKTG